MKNLLYYKCEPTFPKIIQGVRKRDFYQFFTIKNKHNRIFLFLKLEIKLYFAFPLPFSKVFLMNTKEI